MRRSYDKHIRLTKEEKDEWQRKAEMACLNESALVRLLMKGYEPKEKPDECFFEAMRELSSIGNNINQLAAKANSLGFMMHRCFIVKQSVGINFRRILRAYFYDPINQS